MVCTCGVFRALSTSLLPKSRSCSVQAMKTAEAIQTVRARYTSKFKVEAVRPLTAWQHFATDGQGSWNF